MENYNFDFHSDVTPRNIPTQASKFDKMPIPMVPEISLILDKPISNDKSQHESIITVPLASSQSLSSYASWKQSKLGDCQRFESSNSQIHALPTINSKNTINSNNSKNHSLQKFATDLPKSSTRLDEFHESIHPRTPIINNNSKKPFQEISQSCNINYNKNDHSIDHNDYWKSNQKLIRQEPHSPLLHSNHQNQFIQAEGYCKKNSRHSYSPKSYYRQIHHDARDLNSCNRNECSEKDYFHPETKCDSCSNFSREHHFNSQNAIASYDHNIANQNNCRSSCCISNHNNRDTGHSLTVQSLLQLVNTQNEQIRNLQRQVDRLLKLHEQNLKDKVKCSCADGSPKHNKQILVPAMNSNVPIMYNNQDQEIHQTSHTQESYRNTQYKEEPNQAVLEQKVSIGVMTSFELKVQNNQALVVDSEKRLTNSHIQEDHKNTCINDKKQLFNSEMSKKKNSFAPTGLENISEANESHVSSRVASSNFCTNSTRQSLEGNSSAQAKENDYPSPMGHTNVILDSQQVREHSEDLIQNKSENYRLKETSNRINEQDSRDSGFEISNNTFRNPQNFINENQTQQFVKTAPTNQMIINETDSKKPKITASESNKLYHAIDDDLSLCGSNLDIENRNPSPDPSIHIEMQDYESEEGSIPAKHTPQLGWTFYNNVLDQVNQILHNSPLGNKIEQHKNNRQLLDNEECDKNVLMDTVKAATLEQLTKLGISFTDNIESKEINCNKRVTFDGSYYPRLDPQAHFIPPSSNDTSTSLHMKALAMKYLSDQQLTEFANKKAKPGAFQQMMYSSNVQATNMSFATLHYLQRYHLLPGNNLNSSADKGPNRIRDIQNKKSIPVRCAERQEIPIQNRNYSQTSKTTCPSKILDITTLKQQPKLL